MAIDQERCAGSKAGVHSRGFAGVEFDQDEALPSGTVAFRVGANVVKKGLLELEDFFDMHADDQRLGSGCMGIRENDVLELVCAWGKDGGALVDFGGIEQVENREVLDLQDFIHAFKAESTFAIEEVGDMSLFESSLLGQ